MFRPKVPQFFHILGFITLFIVQPATAQNYWQQRADYIIDVRLNDTLHELYGWVSMEYFNNSPDTLNEIFIHTYPNAFSTSNSAFAKQQKGNETLLFESASLSDRGSLTDLQFEINNNSISFETIEDFPDLIKINLKEKIKPKSNVKISTPFKVKIPICFSRLGHDKQNYFITQWFPKIAKYDEDGWHKIPYLDQGEYYHDFGCYKVNINIPANYIVAATGNLTSDSEREKLLQKSKSINWNLINQKPITPISDIKFKTLQYESCDIHDFAWFASKDFWVQHKVYNQNNKKIDLWMFFPPGMNASPWFKNGLDQFEYSMSYFIKNIGDYPYKQCSMVLGQLEAGGGMEYPNIAILGETSKKENSSAEVLHHELGHNWFQGILASNEFKYPFLDEGLNTFYESYKGGFLKDSKKNNNDNDFIIKKLNITKIINVVNQNLGLQQPLHLSSDVYTEINYGADVYIRSAWALNYLKDYLGEENFDKAMHDYYETWKFKHPKPKDLEAIFEQVSGKNLSWFFNELLQSVEPLDYAICKIKSDGSQNIITLKNKGKLNSPISISACNNDSILQTLWIEGFEGKKQVTINNTNAKEFHLNATKSIQELNFKNNYIRKNGIFKKNNFVKLRMISSLKTNNKNTIFVLPALAWNYQDKFMLGAILHNMSIPWNNKFEWEFAPLYSFKQKQLNGLARMQYNIHNASKYSKIYIGATSQQFTDYEARDLQARYFLYKIYAGYRKLHQPLRDKWVSNLQINYLNYLNQNIVIKSFDSIPKYTLKNTNRNLLQVNYSLNNTNTLFPISISLNNDIDFDFARTQFEFKTFFRYPKLKKRGVSFRFFAGKYWFYDIYSNIDNAFTLGGVTANADLAYQNIYLSRNKLNNNHLLNRQLYIAQGGFKSNLTNYSSFNTINFLSSINVKASLPFTKIIGVFGDFATIIQNKNFISNADKIHYQLGVYINVISNVFEIYVPVAYSNELKINTQSQYTKYHQRISFSLQLNQLQLFKKIRNTNKLNLNFN